MSTKELWIVLYFLIFHCKQSLTNESFRIYFLPFFKKRIGMLWIRNPFASGSKGSPGTNSSTPEGEPKISPDQAAKAQGFFEFIFGKKVGPSGVARNREAYRSKRASN
jgi:hypothetical protein